MQGSGPCDGSGDGSGEGEGSGDGSGEGEGSGDGSGEGDGSVDGSGDGSGEGEGSGDGSGEGEGSGVGEGSGAGEGLGVGEGNGDGVGEGPGVGDGPGDGPGAGSGSAPGGGSVPPKVRSPLRGSNRIGEEPPFPLPLALVASFSFCRKASGPIAMYGTPLSLTPPVNAPPRAEAGRNSTSVTARNPITTRPPIPAVIRLSTWSRVGCSTRSGMDLSQGPTCWGRIHT
jgi:hypothetical protein